MKKVRYLLSGTAVASLLVLQAWAGELQYRADIPPSSVNWKRTIGVPKFDPVLGRLESVRIDLKGFVRGDIRVENKSSMPATVENALRALITLRYPAGISGSGGNMIGEVTPGVSYTAYLDKFDRIVDYNGLSGRTYLRQYGEDTRTFVTTDGNDLALFTGVLGDFIWLDVLATGRSTARGAGNLSASFRTDAGASIVVTYAYRSPETPPSQDTGCTRTPGYWKNKPEKWPVDAVLGYSRQDAISLMQNSTSGDMTYVMFEQLVAAYLNVVNGARSDCIWSYIEAAWAWLSNYPLGSRVSASSKAWVGSGESIKNVLDAYNNGKLCAPHCK